MYLFGFGFVALTVCLAGSQAPLMLHIHIITGLELGSGFGRSSLSFYSVVPGGT